MKNASVAALATHSSSTKTARHEPASCSTCEPATGAISGATVEATVSIVIPRMLSWLSFALSAITAYDSATHTAAEMP